MRSRLRRSDSNSPPAGWLLPATWIASRQRGRGVSGTDAGGGNTVVGWEWTGLLEFMAARGETVSPEKDPFYTIRSGVRASAFPRATIGTPGTIRGCTELPSPTK